MSRRRVTRPVPPPVAPIGGTGRRLGGWPLLAVLAATVAAYWRTLHGEFQWDDFHAIVENPQVWDLGAALSGLPRAVLQAGRPVTQLTFALNYAAGGLAPLGYHLVNLAVHLAAVALVFELVRAAARLSGDVEADGLALAVAALFALHPLQTQAVSYVCQRAESLASLLYLASLLLLLAAERAGPTRRGALAWGASLLAFGLGLATKVIVATLPAAYLLLTAVVPDDPGRRGLARPARRLAMLAPFATLDVLYAWRTLRAFAGARDVGFDIPGLPPWTYSLSQLRVVTTYLRLLAWPAGQSVEWVVPGAGGPGDPAVLASGALLAGLLGGALALGVAGRRGGAAAAPLRLAAFGIGLFFLLLAPSSSVVPLADLLEEHRAYLASVGILLAATALVRLGWERGVGARRPWLAPAALAAACGALALATVARNGVWETRLALWSDAVAKAPASWRSHLNLGFARNERGERELAVQEYRRALALGGADGGAREAFILNNLGAALVDAGRPEEARPPFLRAVQLTPDDADLIYNLANVAQQLGQAAEAERLGREALRRQPGHTPTLILLGQHALERGDPVEALALFERGLQATPDSLEARLDVAIVNGVLGRAGPACAGLAEVRRRGPGPALRPLLEEALARSGCRP